jgi:excisionase family DNA binding protein
MSSRPRDSRRASRAPTDVDALLSPEQVAGRCGLSRRAVYRAIERGELRASRLCSRIRVRAADVEAWVDGSQIEPSNGAVPPSRPATLRSREGLRRLLAES